MSTNQFYYLKGQEVHGPVNHSEIKKWFDSGAIKKNFKVCAEGSENWVEVHTLGFCPAPAAAAPSKSALAAPSWMSSKSLTEATIAILALLVLAASFLLVFVGVMYETPLLSIAAAFLSGLCISALLYAVAEALSHLRRIADNTSSLRK